MKVFLLKINSYRLLDDEINKIISGKDNIVYLNYEDGPEVVIEECSYFSLLDSEKYVIVHDFKLDAESKKLEEYLKKSTDNVTLILIIDNLDKRNSLYKYIKNNGTSIEIDDINQKDISIKVNNYCKKIGVTIDYLALNLLTIYSLSNYDVILNEIDKISLITKNIKEEDIKKYSSRLIGEDNFELSDAIINKEYDKVKTLLKDFISSREEVIPFVSLLASSYRIILSSIELKLSSDSLAKKLNIHPYRAKLAIDKSRLYTKEELYDIMLKISDLDYKLKSTGIDSYILLKDFIISTF